MNNFESAKTCKEVLVHIAQTELPKKHASFNAFVVKGRGKLAEIHLISPIVESHHHNRQHYPTNILQYELPKQYDIGLSFQEKEPKDMYKQIIYISPWFIGTWGPCIVKDCVLSCL